MTRRAVVAGIVVSACVAVLLVVAVGSVREDGPSASGTHWLRTDPPAGLAARDRLLGWTGKEVLVFGGTDAEPQGFGGGPEPVHSRTGAAYDPAADSWRVIADAPAALGEGRRTGVVVEDRLVLLTDAGAWWQYDASDDAWTDLPPAPHGGPGGQLAGAGDRVYALAGAPGAQGFVDVLDVAEGSWTSLPLRTRPGGIVSGELVATDDGVAVIGSKAPGAGPHGRLRADVFDSSVWRRTDGPRVWGIGRWQWTGERLVMPMPTLDRETPQPGLALDLATLEWTELGAGPWYEDGGWDVVAAGGTRSYLSGYVYDDADGSWSEVPEPGDAEDGDPGSLAGVVAGDRLVVVGPGSAWVSAWVSAP